MERYQTIGPRFLALLIDSLLAIPFSILIMALSGFTGSSKVSFILTVALTAAPVIYIILMHAYFGQTLGKMAMKVKVLDISERPITFAQAVIRSLPQLLPVFITASMLIQTMFEQMEPRPSNEFTTETFSTLLAIANFLYLFWTIGDIISALLTEKKRALHDFLAGTVVVRTDGWSNLSINSK